ncbi:mitochondrial 2-methylisocitrate lyase [Saitoella coloradoensis]
MLRRPLSRVLASSRPTTTPRVLAPRTATAAVRMSSSSSIPHSFVPKPLEAGQDHPSYISSATKDLTSFFTSPRFERLQRPYSPLSVLSARGSVPQTVPHTTHSATLLWEILNRNFAAGKATLTMGAIDPVQQSQMIREGLEVVYVSGWATSSTFVRDGAEVGPDLGDYPYTSVPAQVERMRKAQAVQDRREWDEVIAAHEEGKVKNDFKSYIRPIIADGDHGHGGLGSVMKLTKLFAEAGASAVHFEDQLHGGKKCGHQAGKVLVATSTHISRLIAARFQWDVMSCPAILIARTDSESAKLIDSDVDPADHEFILGIVPPTNDPEFRPLAETLLNAERAGASGAEIDKLEREWTENYPLLTLDHAITDALTATGWSADKIESEYTAKTRDMSNPSKHAFATRTLGVDVKWDSLAPRTREGYFHFQGGLSAAIKRANAFAKYADLLWVETKTPDVQVARQISTGVRGPNGEKKMMVYNLSPSFDWTKHGFTTESLKSFTTELGQLGFVLQLISLAGLHLSAASSCEFVRSYLTSGMEAYVRLVQKKEKELGTDVLTHQRWSGARVVDRVLGAVASGNSGVSAMGEGSTEASFHEK